MYYGIELSTFSGLIQRYIVVQTVFCVPQLDHEKMTWLAFYLFVGIQSVLGALQARELNFTK